MFKSSSTFDKLLDKATSLSNLEPDWAGILQICDAIRQNDVQPKYAIAAIKKKLYVSNPNVVLMTLQVLESCVKNCGSVFHNEVATKAFMDDLYDVYRQCSDVNVREEILRLIQVFAHAFRNEPSYRAVQDLMKSMKAEGLLFPVLKETDAMFSASTAPEWADGECCHRCRVQFTMVVRKHHCRACGQVFCAKCSSKTSPIPKFGIEKEVRVCEVCYDKINKKLDTKPSDEPKAKVSTMSAPSSAPSSAPNKKTEQEIQEEEELQLAIALSKSEAEIKERERLRYSQFSTPKANSANPSPTVSSSSSSKHKKSSKSKISKSTSKKSSKVENGENEDPELARYLNREYWEQRTTPYADYEPSPSPSAPQPSLNVSKISNVEAAQPKVFKDKLASSPNENDELESFTNTLRSTIEIFVNRLNSNKLRGRPITNDNGVQSLFMNLTNMHSQLIMYTQQINEARTNCERLQDKISQIRDARAALDALREEHRDQLRRAAEEAERVRQQQMAQKLEIMRKKKQEYLQYQQQMALQRMQEQELMIRNEQFKQFNPNVIPNVGQNVGLPQWNSAPTGNYYVPNQSFANAMPNQQAMSNSPQQPVITGQYVQAPMPSNPNMVASHQPTLANSVASIPVPVQGPISQGMPQFVGPIAPNMYMPGVVPNYQQPDHQQNAQPPAMYQMAHPGGPPVANPQQQLQQQQQLPQASESNEELLIKFD